MPNFDRSVGLKDAGNKQTLPKMAQASPKLFPDQLSVNAGLLSQPCGRSMQNSVYKCSQVWRLARSRSAWNLFHLVDTNRVGHPIREVPNTGVSGRCTAPQPTAVAPRQ